MGKKFDYLQNHIDRLEHTNALLAHEEHILEFKALCADMIKEATPSIKDECIQEMKRMLPPEPKKEEVQVKINMKDIKR